MGSRSGGVRTAGLKIVCRLRERGFWLREKLRCNFFFFDGFRMDLESDLDILGELFDECKKGRKMVKVEDGGKDSGVVSEGKLGENELFEVGVGERVRFNSL